MNNDASTTRIEQLKINDPSSEEAVAYPFQLPIKVIGLTSPKLEPTVLKIIRLYAPDVDGHEISTTSSKNGKYTSITCVFEAKSRAHLEEIYAALNANQMIKMVL